MITYKKIFSFIAFLSLTNATLAADVENYDSGRSRIAAIMENDETGIAAYNKQHIHYAETRNLDNDLDIQHIAEFFACKTLMGQKFLTETLKFPINIQDKDTVLAQRQHAIRMLVDNPELKNEIETLLEQAKREEQEVIKLMSDFFMGKTCPELKSLELIKQQNPSMLPFMEFALLNPTGKTVFTALNLIGLAGSLTATHYLARMTYHMAKAGVDCTKSAFFTGYLGLVSVLSSYGLYKEYMNGAEKRSKLHALNQLITIAEKFENLCNQYDIKNQFKISAIKDTKGIALLQQLKASRYQDKKSIFFMVPFVHTFLYKVYREEKHLAEVFACIAELDAYNAIATKIIESQTQKNKFCFVEFVDNQKSFIKAQAFWNVLVTDAIANDVTENKHIILTGPNAGGKTTAIRAILQNIMLGQCFGIAAAESWRMTMFDVIHSYLNISDDITKGLSLFASELKRAQEILQRIKTLQPDSKFFFALDELFTGTVAEDGEQCAYEFVKKIAEFDGVQFIYATHFEKLKELGREQYCSNYKVGAPTKNNEGKLIYPFTLSRGENDARVALDLARQAQLFE